MEIELNIHVKPLLALWEWQGEAACHGMDISVFFSPGAERGSARRAREATAKEVCAGCPVQLPCAEFAVSTGQRYGVWGGLTESERNRVPRPDRR
ncbi:MULTISPECIES: WhiB family transcriptional regulator [unclassified Streptomyces]|uniref:WhiB family transcriptional regulator n=1 Tax=unclassified Streptomyces TaxID=2593676 RepID=UPI00386A0553